MYYDDFIVSEAGLDTEVRDYEAVKSYLNSIAPKTHPRDWYQVFSKLNRKGDPIWLGAFMKGEVAGVYFIMRDPIGGFKHKQLSNPTQALRVFRNEAAHATLGSFLAACWSPVIRCMFDWQGTIVEFEHAGRMRSVIFRSDYRALNAKLLDDRVVLHAANEVYSMSLTEACEKGRHELSDAVFTEISGNGIIDTVYYETPEGEVKLGFTVSKTPELEVVLTGKGKLSNILKPYCVVDCDTLELVNGVKVLL